MHLGVRLCVFGENFFANRGVVFCVKKWSCFFGMYLLCLAFTYFVFYFFNFVFLSNPLQFGLDGLDRSVLAVWIVQSWRSGSFGLGDQDRSVLAIWIVRSWRFGSFLFCFFYLSLLFHIYEGPAGQLWWHT